MGTSRMFCPRGWGAARIPQALAGALSERAGCCFLHVNITYVAKSCWNSSYRNTDQLADTVSLCGQTILTVALTAVPAITTPSLSLVTKCCFLALPSRDPVIPITLRISSSVAEVPALTSDLLRRATTELFKDSGLPSQIICHSRGEREHLSKSPIQPVKTRPRGLVPWLSGYVRTLRCRRPSVSLVRILGADMALLIKPR
ncbi:uncharacterized protein LOC124243670 [Equus quagga]|uniref:uncharacterized protein LOC124243670 n=1 Tax=Equus quagga TaxID=89248 RepID=UPI001EE30617|nr:uncharacterized protein LOC124243670 [Equus quagga]